MNWFEKLFGFPERSYAETKAKFVHQNVKLVSQANGRSWAVGELEMAPLFELRRRVAQASIQAGAPRVRIIEGDVRKLHAMPEYSGALFQVASQFNALEMVGPGVTPEDGVTRYQHDHTQGPACAMAAAPALIVRNYFAPVEGGPGQTRDRQLDGLAGVGAALGAALGRDVGSLWTMRNGYALCSRDGLEAIARHLSGADEGTLEDLRGPLAVAIQRGVEVTEPGAPEGHVVSQAFCSALPVAYSRLSSAPWGPFAVLVLEAAYEATLLEAALTASRGGSHIVLLTLLGGGAFGNDAKWIFQGMRHALAVCAGVDLDIRIVSYGRPPAELIQFVDELGS